MRIKRFNESIKDDKRGILEDIFRSLEDDYDVKIESDEFKIDIKKIPSYRNPHYADLLQTTIERKENEIMSSKYINSIIKDEKYHKQMRSNKTEEDYDLIMKYYNSKFYRICITPLFNTNHHHSKTKSLIKEYKNLIEIANSYELDEVWTINELMSPSSSQVRETMLIFN